MRSFSKMLLALGLAASMTASAHAQGGRGPGMGGPGAGANLTNKSVQKELKLSDEQVKKAETLMTDMREKMMEKFQEARELEGDEQRVKMQALQKEMATEIKKATSELLTPEQSKRFEQITLQSMGVNAFNDPDVAKKLKITDDQKAKIKDLGESMMSQMGEIRQTMQDDREGAMKKMTALRAENTTKGMAILTSEQKATWKEMTGEPFEMKMEGGMQGRPRRQQD